MSKDMPKHLLIIEDDRTFAKIISSFLQKNDFEVEVCTKGQEALKRLEEKRFDLVITDFRLPDTTGIEVLHHLKEKNIQLPTILMTGYSDIRIAVKAMKLGAHDYIVKPINPDELLLTVQNALKSGEPSSATGSTLKSNTVATSTKSFGFLKGISQASKELYEQVQLVAPTPLSVIVLGESGTGKEFVARMIHQLSSRAAAPFVALDCGALSKELAASELFGHLKGAFTGALSDKAGQFEEANGGTIFLDEIGNLSYEVQVKLLRAIQERKIRRVGSNKDIAVDVRIIAATNEDLVQQSRQGDFREDLYHRLNEFSLKISPLRERKKDIMHYAKHFLEMANQELGKAVQGFEENVADIFNKYPWYGNLRELKNVVKRAVLLAKGAHIGSETLPTELIQEALHPESRPLEETGLEEGKDLRKNQEQMEKDLILKALLEAKYNKTKAARLLNIDRKTLYNKMERYNIEV